MSYFLDDLKTICRTHAFVDEAFNAFIESQISARMLLRNLIRSQWITAGEIEHHAEPLYQGLKGIMEKDQQPPTEARKEAIQSRFDFLLCSMRDRERRTGSLAPTESSFEDDSDSEASDDTIRPAKPREQEATEPSNTALKRKGKEEPSDEEIEKARVEKEHELRTNALLESMSGSQQQNRWPQTIKRPKIPLPFTMFKGPTQLTQDCNALLINPTMLDGPPKIPPGWNRR